MQSAIGREAGLPITVPCVGPLLGLHFASEPARDYDGAKRTDETAYARFFHGMLAEGVAMAPGAYEALFVGVAHTDDVLDRIADAAHRAAGAACST